jgi:hypothetical protein
VRGDRHAERPVAVPRRPAPAHARFEDRVKAIKQTGMGRFPSREFAINQGDGALHRWNHRLPRRFTREWAGAMHEDIMTAIPDAVARKGGAVGRGPQRYHVEIHPEQFRGFVDLATHPWVTALPQAVLGPDYEIVEIGFDIPFPGAQNQPWHRDFHRSARDLRATPADVFGFST